MDIVQSISSPHGVSTFGSAVVRLDPDQAIVEFSISVVEPRPAGAFNALRGKSAGVNGAMNRLGAENVTFKTSQTQFEESHMVSKLKGHNTAFRASLEYRATIKNLQYVDAVLTSVVEAGGMSLQPLQYTSTRISDARAESRQMAVLAALRKAQLYAEAAGVDIGRVLHIEDIDPSRLSARAGKVYDFDEMQMAGPPRPGSVDITAAVLVSYAIKGAGTPETTGQYRVL